MAGNFKAFKVELDEVTTDLPKGISELETQMEHQLTISKNVSVEATTDESVDTLEKNATAPEISPDIDSPSTSSASGDDEPKKKFATCEECDKDFCESVGLSESQFAMLPRITETVFAFAMKKHFAEVSGQIFTETLGPCELCIACTGPEDCMRYVLLDQFMFASRLGTAGAIAQRSTDDDTQ